MGIKSRPNSAPRLTVMERWLLRRHPAYHGQSYETVWLAVQQEAIHAKAEYLALIDEPATRDVRMRLAALHAMWVDSGGSNWWQRDTDELAAGYLRGLLRSMRSGPLLRPIVTTRLLTPSPQSDRKKGRAFRSTWISTTSKPMSRRAFHSPATSSDLIRASGARTITDPAPRPSKDGGDEAMAQVHGPSEVDDAVELVASTWDQDRQDSLPKGYHRDRALDSVEFGSEKDNDHELENHRPTGRAIGIGRPPVNERCPLPAAVKVTRNGGSQESRATAGLTPPMLHNDDEEIEDRGAPHRRVQSTAMPSPQQTPTLLTQQVRRRGRTARSAPPPESGSRIHSSKPSLTHETLPPGNPVFRQHPTYRGRHYQQVWAVLLDEARAAQAAANHHNHQDSESRTKLDAIWSPFGGSAWPSVDPMMLARARTERLYREDLQSASISRSWETRLRVAALVLVVLILLSINVFVALTTRVGPRLLVIVPGRGVHLLDVIILVSTLMIGAMVWRKLR